jgi:hypothetical protein
LHSAKEKCEWFPKVDYWETRDISGKFKQERNERVSMLRPEQLIPSIRIRAGTKNFRSVAIPW